MKLKKIFALALAVCMMVSAMPTTLAADGVLTSGGTSGSGDGVLTSGGSSSLTLTSGGSTVSRITSGSAQTRQDGVLYSTGSGSEGGGTPVDDPIVPVLDEPKATDTENLGEGSDSYRGPALDEKDYTLSKTASKVGAANANPGDPNTSDKIAIDKTVTDNKNGTYTISLSASTASSTVTVAAPGNIVLVLDASESMQGNETIGGVTKTKAVWLEEAVDNFLDAVPAGSNVAIVGYGDSAYCHTNTNLSKAFLPVDTKLADLKSAADDVRKATLNETYNSSHGKYTNKGLKMAVEILQASNSDLPSIVVLFTDGTPSADLSTQTWWQDSDFKIAQEALHWSTILKSDAKSVSLNYNDEFYTSGSKASSDTFAGMLTGCDADVYCVAIGLPDKNLDSDCENHWSYLIGIRCDCCVANEFLWRASSMRPDSSNRSGWEGNYSDDRTHGGKYYLVGSMANVGDLFGNIEVENGLTLGNVTVKDVLPAYMEVVNSNGGTTTFDAATGKTTIAWAGELVPGKTVSETLTVKFKDGFLGGHSVPTNDAASGIYVGDTMAAAFGIPTVNVPVPEITYVTAVDKNIYLGKTLSNAELLEGVKATYTAGGKTFTIDPTKTNFGLESWQTAYTNSIVFSVKDETVFTLGCTITPNEAQTTIYQPVSKTGNATITVFKPHITFNDSTIYLGVEADYEDNHDKVCVQWFDDDENEAVPEDMTGNEPNVTITYNKPTGYFTECTNVSVKTVKLDTYAARLDDVTFVNADDNAEDHQFTVHVVKPVVEFQPSTIYLGYEPTDDDFEDYNIVKAGVNHKITWTHTKDDGSYTEDYDYPDVTFAFDTKGANYTDCAPISATVYSDGLKSHDGNFTVHVLKPSFSVRDGYIYQGQTKDLTECITLDGWSDKSSCKKNENIVGDEPDKDAFVFIVDGVADVKAFAEMECTPLNVSAASINHKDAIDYFASEDFTVHVLKPHFTVTTTDLWADYGTKVDLYKDGENYSAIDAVTGVSHTWVYNGDCTGDNVHPAELPAGAPTIALKDVTFVEGETHTMGAVDGKVTVSGLKYTNKEIVNEETDQLIEQTASLDDVAISYVDDKGYVALFVNKFDLTINKSWMDGEKVADGTYQQDAIFTVAHGQDTFKVVLPAGQPNVKVTGLLCGQDYTVTEDTAWTWRWESDDAKTVAAKTTKHEVSASDPHGEETDHIEKVSFTNSLKERIGKLWLSFCTMVANIFQKGGSF